VQSVPVLGRVVAGPGRKPWLCLGLIFLAPHQERNQLFLYSRYTDFNKRKVQLIARIVQGFDAASP